MIKDIESETKFIIADEITTILDAIRQVQILVSVLCDEVIYLKDINIIFN